MRIYSLYLKTHNITGLKYLGQTVRNPFKYRGSGIDWTPHLEKYGNNVKTEVIFTTTNLEELGKVGEYYSELWHIVKAADDFGNKIWANLKPETGDGGGFGNGGGIVAVKDKNGNTFAVETTDSRLLSGELKHVTSGQVTVRDINGGTLNVDINDPRYLSGELKSITTGFVAVKDKNGNTFKVTKDDPRYLSGELVGVRKGMVSVRDKDGNTFGVSKNDPRYLSGELKHVNCKYA